MIAQRIFKNREKSIGREDSNLRPSAPKAHLCKFEIIHYPLAIKRFIDVSRTILRLHIAQSTYLYIVNT